ncbi:MAG TPA: radical SAM protein [Methanosarcinales archaeon]|nr:radical SAM protein [Methanosarcinales archaeon]
MKIRKYLWEIANIIKGNDQIVIKPTTRCNLKCSYCAANFVHGRPSKFTEVTVDDWILMIDKRKPSAVTLSGGEPAVYEELPELINRLVAKGYLITIFSNISDIRPFMKIPKTWRVKFYSTYHPNFSLQKYKFNLKILSNRFYVDIREVRAIDDPSPKYIKESKTKVLMVEQNKAYAEMYAPNLSLFHSCYDMDNNEEN